MGTRASLPPRLSVFRKQPGFFPKLTAALVLGLNKCGFPMSTYFSLFSQRLLLLCVRFYFWRALVFVADNRASFPRLLPLLPDSPPSLL